jgi:Fe2+ transport system protein FeoA
MKTYEVIDVPQKIDCENCVPCLRLKMMDMGFIHGQQIEISEKKLGLYLVNILSDSGQVDSTVGLRPEELERICLKEIL